MNIITYNVRGLGRGGEMGSNKEIDQKRKCRYDVHSGNQKRSQ